MRVASMSPGQIRAAERTLSIGTWAITFGAVVFSVLTVTPLVQRVTPDGWQWTAPILPVVVDAAVVIVVRLDSTVARLGGDSGRWPAVLRWMTGLMTVGLNIGDSALGGDLVGVAVHCVAPLLLIVTAEAGLSYRRAIAAALARIDREQQEQAERERLDSEARERRVREEREQERAARERSEREAREHAERMERERLDREAQERREAREHTERIERERLDREDQHRREEREERERLRREEQERADRERQRKEAQEAAERADRQARERQAQAAREQRERQARERPQQSRRMRREQPAARPVNTEAAAEKVPEQAALEAVRLGLATGRSIRQTAELTGWSLGWVQARYQELKTAEQAATETEEVAA
ncbi:DUF2637 domain-containing protein [Streptomyces sp. NPDC057743]|uniref:DUF2637 domain-containing protein n=1 Tax=Streptomyces sp. NPDC057743 TaxID=3346236 RepID=UPI0036C87171